MTCFFFFLSWLSVTWIVLQLRLYLVACCIQSPQSAYFCYFFSFVDHVIFVSGRAEAPTLSLSVWIWWRTWVACPTSLTRSTSSTLPSWDLLTASCLTTWIQLPQYYSYVCYGDRATSSRARRLHRHLGRQPRLCDPTLYQRGRCVKGRGPILPITQQINKKNNFELVLAKWSWCCSNFRSFRGRGLK